MNFLTDNFISNFFKNSKKTDDELNEFVNKKFTYYLNHSNLFKNFISDFENYKKDDKKNDTNYCDECENLYILTTNIFENYINKIKIPIDIDIYSEGKENSKINYKNKILYFFDLQDLKEILKSKNLYKSSSDTRIMNKKKILCKIISLSFIKIYIIIKSIHQTFNIYGSLIEKKPIIQDNIEEEQPAIEEQPLEEQPEIQPAIQPAIEPSIEQKPAIEEKPAIQQILPEPAIEQILPIQVDKAPQNGGDGFFGNLFDNIFKKDTIQNADTNQTAAINPGLDVQTVMRKTGKTFEKSKNVFYSTFVILFENNNIDLTADNFNEEFLNNSLSSITNENLSKNIPEFIKYICDENISNAHYIIKNSIIFNNDNFKFIKIKTTDDDDASSYLKDIDEQYSAIYRKNIENKEKKLKKIFDTGNSKDFLLNYCNNNINSSKFTNYKMFDEIKKHLIIMISNYFKIRRSFYDKIIQKIIIFDKNNTIERLNPNLTYKLIVELTEQTKEIILDLHSAVFKSLNNILTIIYDEIDKNEDVKAPIDEDVKEPIKEPIQEPKEPIQEPIEPVKELVGGKTRKKHNKRKRKNKKMRTIKRKKN